MKYLPDTNAWIGYLNKPSGPLGLKLVAQPSADIALCSVVIGELLTGAYKSARQAPNLALLRRLEQQFLSLPYDNAAADRYAQVRAHLERLGTPIGPYDLQIAAIALTNGLTVITHNTGEFGRVPTLAMEDWTVP